MTDQPYSGGCLCGALRYEARGEPIYAGHCYCADCRKSSGSGFIPFMGFAADQVTITGPSLQSVCKAATGGEATRNFCPSCGGLVHGGVVGKATSYTIYAGTLDEPARFTPRIAIFTRERPDWALIPPGLTIFPRHPSDGQ